MPRSIRFHPVSLALGAVGCGLALYLASAAPLAGPMTLRIDGIPAVSQMVRLEATDLPYAVPAGTSLVITGMGSLSATGGFWWSSASIAVDGKEVLVLSTANGSDTRHVNVSPGVVVPEGSQIDATLLHTSAAPFVLFGYLARD